jgi:hypothetical protein
MISLAVASALMTYVWIFGLQGNLMSAGGSQVQEQLIVEAYNWANATLRISVRNVGKVTITVSSVYLGGNIQSSGLENQAIPVFGVIEKFWSPVGSFSAGSGYTLKIVTVTGAIFAAQLINGGSG